MPSPKKNKRPIEVYCVNENCRAPDSMAFTPSEFDDWISEGEFDCGTCGEEMTVDGVSLECHICDAEIEYSSLSDIPLMMDERCPNCAGPYDVDFYSIRVAGSWSSMYDVYDWIAEGKEISSLERKGRTDYWEGLVHFCSAEEFISIYKERRIRAAATGLYHKLSPEKTKAVCLTEATRPNWNEIKEVHGEYGFVFRKRDIIALGGAPAIYVPESTLLKMSQRGERVPETLWPYLNKLKLPSSDSRSKIDFLHEREWRVPGDIIFDATSPYAVTFSRVRPDVEEEELILEAAREFQELGE